jgi:hypothetical protein
MKSSCPLGIGRSRVLRCGAAMGGALHAARSVKGKSTPRVQ